MDFVNFLAQSDPKQGWKNRDSVSRCFVYSPFTLKFEFILVTMILNIQYFLKHQN